MANSADPRLGWSKDKWDKRDYLHRRVVVKLPESFFLTDLLPSVRDQGQVGSCVGHGIGANLCGVAKTLAIFTEWFSPTWIYNGARYLEGTLLWDLGCYPKDALEWLLQSGTLLEHFWPYDPTKLDTRVPGSTMGQNAVKYQDFAYWRVVDGVDGICSAIASGHLVSIGTPWFNKWMNPPDGNLEPVTADDTVAGGHETILHGYNIAQELVYGMNSWSEEWGHKGLYAMPFSAFPVFKALGGYDAHYITFNPTPLPPEPPVPPNPGCLTKIIKLILR